MMRDSVNHPAHYTAGRTEVIDVLEDAAAHAPDPVSGGLQWQALKYLLRMWLKGNPLEDAKKARWYLERLTMKLEDKSVTPPVPRKPQPTGGRLIKGNVDPGKPED